MSIRLVNPWKDRRFLKMEAKKKKRAERKKATKTQIDQGQLVHQPLVPITLEEYMPEEWFKMVEEDEEEEVL